MPSLSIFFSLLLVFGESAASCVLGQWTTGVTVGLILIKYAPGMDFVAFFQIWMLDEKLFKVLVNLFILYKVEGFAHFFG